MKKTLSLILVLVMCLGLTVPAFAEEKVFTATDNIRGNVATITNVVGVVTRTYPQYGEDPQEYTIYIIGDEGCTLDITAAPGIPYAEDWGDGWDDTEDYAGYTRMSMDWSTEENEFQGWMGDNFELASPIHEEFGPYTEKELGFDDFFGGFSLKEPSLHLTGQILWMYESAFNQIVSVDGLKGLTNADRTNSGSQPQQPAGPQVSDWAKDQVAKASAKGLVPDGLGDDYRANITRAQFAAVVVKLYLAKTGYGEPYVEDMESPFTDTNDPAVLQASVLNLVNGMGDGTFAPNALVTREQAAVMLSQVHLRTGGSIGAKGPTFDDSSSISEWAKYYVSFMNEKGIISGVGDNKFNPKGSASIEQALSISLRMLEKLK